MKKIYAILIMTASAISAQAAPTSFTGTEVDLVTDLISNYEYISCTSVTSNDHVYRDGVNDFVCVRYVDTNPTPFTLSYRKTNEKIVKSRPRGSKKAIYNWYKVN